MKWLYSLICTFFLVSVAVAQTDTSYTVPDPKAPMVPPYSIEYFNTNAAAIPKDTTKMVIVPGPPVFKPKVSLGTGMLSFYGDLYGKHYQAPWTSRVGYDLNVSHRLNRYLQINFNILFGKLGAFENTATRHENFQSEIRAGGVNLLYDFGNFIPDQYWIRPWISAGITSFEFLSKTDLKDRNGETYYYWKDGSIKNMAEGSANSQNAKDLVRDYKYETDIRERNADGFGKYPERSFAFPLGFGALMEISPRFDFKIGVQYYLTTTDYVDGISDKSVGDRKGTKSKDKFVYSSFSLQYDLVADLKTKMEDTLSDAYYDGIDWLAIENMDYDKDGVKDFDDECQGTPEGVKVNKKGCPLDDDEDGVPNYLDDENPSPKGFEVNMHGVAQTDEFWQNWYDHYFDSLGLDRNTEIIGNAFDLATSKPKSNTSANTTNEQRVYTIELARYAAGVPSDEMAFLLSIGDIKSTILDDGSTVVYTAGTYEDVKVAVQRRDEFRAEGNKKSQVGYFKNEKYFSLTDEELQKAMNNSSAVNSNTSATTNTASANTNTSTVTDNSFAKGGIVYRVQLGAYKNRISLKAFNNSANVVELKTEEGTYRYVTAGHKTVAEAAAKKADLFLLGYTDAFVTAYKDGKRIAMNAAGATMATKEKEDLNENKTFSSVDKSLINFKIQIGALKRPAQVKDMDDRVKGLEGVGKQTTATGQVRYTIGKYSGYNDAEKARKEMEDKGFPEAFIIATFKEEIISLQEAMELLK
jgi:cell division septation protein DedD